MSRKTSEEPLVAWAAEGSHREMMTTGTEAVGDGVKRYLVGRNF